MVRWKRPSDDGDAVATGYQMLLDDKQFGDLIPLDKLHAKITVSPPNIVLLKSFEKKVSVVVDSERYIFTKLY